jgi:large subunit ribosomal protein L18
MINKKTEKRIRLKKKIRTKISGTTKNPRLSVFRSNNHMYAQIIDDSKNKTIVSSSDLSIAGTDTKKKEINKQEKAKLVGQDVAQKAIEKGITTCVFDRNGFKYTGRVKALADGARSGGLKF